jgi:hypothetical protein
MRKLVLLLATVALFTLAGVALADQTVQYPVGPIWNDGEAQQKCEAYVDKVAQANPGKTVSWDGNWKTVVEGKQSVCSYRIED